MFDILVVSHGHLSEALLATASLVYGEPGEGVDSLTFLPGNSADALHDSILRAVQASSGRGGTLVLCDIMGGSPFLMSAKVYGELEDKGAMEVVTGVNLGMLIEAMAARQTTSLGDVVPVVMGAGATAMQSLSQRLKA